MGDSDIGSKYIVELDPTAWIRWLLHDPAAEVEAQLTGEFKFVERRNDLLFRVHSSGRTFLVLIEIQAYYDREMPARMLAYTALARARYGLPVYPIVIYLLPPTEQVQIPRNVHDEIMGIITHQDFVVVELWELDAALMAAQAPTTFLPLVPLMRGIEARILYDCMQRVEQESTAAAELKVVLAIFASRTLGKEVVERIMSIDTRLLEEFPLYKEMWLMAEERAYKQVFEKALAEGHTKGIEEGREKGIVEGRAKGIAEGRAKGIAEGRAEGRTAEALSNLVTILYARLGDVPPTLHEQIAQLTAEQLETLIVAAIKMPNYAEFAQQVQQVQEQPPESTREDAAS